MPTRGEVTRTSIVSSAERLFRKQGYARTTMDDICRESGVKRGNLYFHFRSKEDVAQAAIEQALRRHIPFIETLMSDETDPLRRVALMIDGIVSYHAARGCNTC